MVVNGTTVVHCPFSKWMLSMLLNEPRLLVQTTVTWPPGPIATCGSEAFSCDRLSW